MADKKVNFDFRRLREQNGLPTLDTGSTYVHLTRPLFNLFTNAFSDFCSLEPKNCGGKTDFVECFYYMPERHGSLEQFMGTFPTVRFGLGAKQDYELRPEDYMVLNSEVEAFYCPGFQSLDRTVLGAVFMQNHDILFDRQKKRIGFVRAAFDASMVEEETSGVEEDWPDDMSGESQGQNEWLGGRRSDRGWWKSASEWLHAPFVKGFLGMAAKTVGLFMLFMVLYVVVFVIRWTQKGKTASATVDKTSG